jgi:hypothetical protein
MNKKRATRKDAHQTLAAGIGGGMAASDYLSDEDRRAIAMEAASRLEAVVRDHLPRTQNLEYAILKTHLIVEYAINEYIRCLSRVLVDSKDLRFTFFPKLEIAVLNGFVMGCTTTVPSIELLNQIRNQVAHRFSFDMSLLNELILINSDDSEPDPTTWTDRQRIARLKIFPLSFAEALPVASLP